MFAPCGYESLHVLWNDFVRRHAESLCAIARTKYIATEPTSDRYPWPDFEAFGSPADFVEQAFIETFDVQAITLVTAHMAIGRYATIDPNSQFRLLERLSVFEATTHVCEHDPEATIAALRDERSLTREQRKAWSENMGHEGETITDRHYAKIPGESRAELLEEIGTDDQAKSRFGPDLRRRLEEIRNELDACLKASSPDEASASIS
ncbi:hypothetical protein [Palleronia pelagia]|uniref:Uncharacterized protein n=1 Tax=Palleronia pelagia TaxID=387096 RepID=A0A1H8AJK5_9RHOB|nr:hypothetical protein [Palleronia pelagia]SEM69707.1 hypothetical protein SAMN04488011_101152 [Palleronia pelagia]